MLKNENENNHIKIDSNTCTSAEMFAKPHICIL